MANGKKNAQEIWNKTLSLSSIDLLWNIMDAHIAQSVEHFLGKEEVTGSNPVMGSESNHVNIVIM